MGRQRSCTNLWRRYPPDPAKMGGGSGSISGRFAIGSSDFLLLQQRWLRLHWPRSLLAVDTPRSWTQWPRSARLIRLSTRPSIAAVPVSFAAAIRRLSRKSLKEQIGVLMPRLTADPLADSHRDWFCSLNLKDAYFHIQIAPHHRRFLRFAFEGVAYQYTVLPFGLSLAPRTFMKCMDAALSPLRQMGIRILNYLDDWLILAQSEVELLSHRTLILSHLERLGLRVNFAKSALSPSQRVSFLGTVLDSAHMRAVIAPERALAIQKLAATFKSDTARPLKVFQRMLGLMAAASPVLQLGLLRMRPLQRWF